MQKKLIALAVAGLASTGAFAQTNVTVYGLVDAAFIYTNVNGGDRNNTAANEQHGRDTFAIQSGQLAGSRLGFKGTEDLGNGLKAVFVLEYALANDINAGIGTGALAARQQYVGLSGKAGAVTLGRQYAPGYYAAAANDALAASPALSVTDAAAAFIGSSIRGASPARWNNAVNYASPTMGGFSGQVIYAMGENTNELAMGESYGIGAKYAAGPVSVNYVYHNAAVTQGANAGVLSEHYVGGSFDLKVVKLIASAQTLDGGNRALAGQARQGSTYTFGAVVPVGRGNIHAGYAYGDADSSTNAPDTFNGTTQGVSVAYTHGLSKRTTLYTGLRYQSSDSRNAVNAATQASGNLTAFGAGIMHTF